MSKGIERLCCAKFLVGEGLLVTFLSHSQFLLFFLFLSPFHLFHLLQLVFISFFYLLTKHFLLLVFVSPAHHLSTLLPLCFFSLTSKPSSRLLKCSSVYPGQLITMIVKLSGRRGRQERFGARHQSRCLFETDRKIFPAIHHPSREQPE